MSMFSKRYTFLTFFSSKGIEFLRGGISTIMTLPSTYTYIKYITFILYIFKPKIEVSLLKSETQNLYRNRKEKLDSVTCVKKRPLLHFIVWAGNPRVYSTLRSVANSMGHLSFGRFFFFS